MMFIQSSFSVDAGADALREAVHDGRPALEEGLLELGLQRELREHGQDHHGPPALRHIWV